MIKVKNMPIPLLHAGLSNNDKIKSIRNCAFAKDGKILCDQALQNNAIRHGTSMRHNNNDKMVTIRELRNQKKLVKFDRLLTK